MPRPFRDRADAGRQLAAMLIPLGLPRPVVYALPRGGVPVAVEIAVALGAPLDLMLVRKLGAPGQPELAIGAVVDGAAPETVLNHDIIAGSGATEDFIAEAQTAALAEIERRRARYLAGRAPIDPRGCSAIVVDDGLATGATARAALHALRRRAPHTLLLAVPVAPPDAIAAMRDEADRIICVYEAEIPRGVGGWYDDFHQLDDTEVLALLARAGTGA